MNDDVQFSAEVKIQDTALLVERLEGMVPSIAESVETHPGSCRVIFASGVAMLNYSGNSVSINVEAEDAMTCQGIKTALAGILADLLINSPSTLHWAYRR